MLVKKYLPDCASLLKTVLHHLAYILRLARVGGYGRCGCGFDQSELTTDKSNKGESCTWYAAYKRAGGYLHNIPLEIGRDRKGVGRRGKMVCSKYTQVS